MSPLDRRRLLQNVAGIGGCLLAGCATESTAPTDTRRRTTDRASDEPTATDSGSAGWTPEWRRSLRHEDVLGLTSAGGSLYGIAGDGGQSVVTSIEPSDGTVVWQTATDGEPINGSYAGYRSIGREQWGVTIAADTVYSVHGVGKSWTELHALDSQTGATLWSLRRDRSLTVHAVIDGLLVASGEEFFVPEHTHDTPDGPLSSTIYGIDASSGTVRWTREYPGVADVGVGPRGIYVATVDGLVGVSRGGTEEWTVGTENPSRSVHVTNGRLYYLTEIDNTRSRVSGVDPDGSRRWRHEMDVSEGVLDGERLYAGGDRVLVLDPDGSTVWADDAHGVWLVLDAENGRLYTRARGQVRCYTVVDGEESWTYDPPDKTYAWPEVATRDTAVVQGFGEDRTLYALDSRTGAPRKSYAPDRDWQPYTITTLDGRLFIGDANSRITALEL